MVVSSAFVQRHPVLIFYALVFAISWGGILALIIPGTAGQKGAAV